MHICMYVCTCMRIHEHSATYYDKEDVAASYNVDKARHAPK